jgi:NAD(P) transhydrogenase
MTVRLGSAVKDIVAKPTGVEVNLAADSVVKPDFQLYAAGRTGKVGSLGLDSVGIEIDHRGRIKVVTVTLQTSVPHIYAAADVMEFPNLAYTSREQGRVAACHAFGNTLQPPPETVPYGIYAVPEISMVGQSDKQVGESDVPYKCSVARIRKTSRSHFMGVNSRFLILISTLDTRRLLGAHIVGEGANRIHPYRAGRHQPRGHGRFLCQQHLQLSQPGRNLQDCGAGCVEPDWSGVKNCLFTYPLTTHLSRSVTSSSDAVG